MSLPLAGGFLSTVPPGKSRSEYCLTHFTPEPAQVERWLLFPSEPCLSFPASMPFRKQEADLPLSPILPLPPPLPSLISPSSGLSSPGDSGCLPHSEGSVPTGIKTYFLFLKGKKKKKRLINLFSCADLSCSVRVFRCSVWAVSCYMQDLVP